MKKVLSLLKTGLCMALTVSLLASMAACSNDNPSSSGAESAGSSAVSEEIVVRLPTYKAGENVGATFFLPQVERFNEKYQGKYRINVEEVPQASYGEQIKQLAQQKKLPVIMHAGVDNEWFKSVAIPNGFAYDLTQWLENTPAKDFFIQESVDYSTREGKLITSPAAVVRPMGLFYNSALYQPEKPIHEMTVEEFVDSLGDNKIAFQTADNAWCTVLLLSDLIANEEGGQELLRQHVDEKLADLTQAPILNAVTKLQKILQENASANTVGAAYADAANSFMSEGAAVIFNGSWMASEFTPDSSDKWSNSFDGAAVRADLLPGNIGLANTSGFGDWWIAATATEEELELAMAWLDFVYSQEELEAYMLAEGGSAPNLTYTEEFQTAQGESQVLADLSNAINEDTVMVPALGDILPTSVAETELGKMLPQLIDNTLTPEEFCRQLSQKAADALS